MFETDGIRPRQTLSSLERYLFLAKTIVCHSVGSFSPAVSQRRSLDPIFGSVLKEPMMILSKLVGKYIYRAPLITSESEAYT